VLAVVLTIGAIEAGMWLNDARQTWRSTAVYDPPVLAGQIAVPWCSGGFYVRRGEDILITTAAHCGQEGMEVPAPDGSRLGVLGPVAEYTPCPHPDHQCLASDMMAITIDPAHIPWGHLNEVDMGAGGYRVIPPGTQPLACGDIAIGDSVEIDGRARFRTGTVLEISDILNDRDPNYFPCMVAADIRVQSGDSGGAVLVNGLPAGITSREFTGFLGFTPLAEGLEVLGLELCTDPDCGLVPPR
jgi:hypothetical protein